MTDKEAVKLCDRRPPLKDLGWCLVELLGHRRIAGKVEETYVAGHVCLQVTAYGEAKRQPILITYCSAQSLYSVTELKEDEARKWGTSFDFQQLRDVLVPRGDENDIDPDELV